MRVAEFRIYGLRTFKFFFGFRANIFSGLAWFRAGGSWAFLLIWFRFRVGFGV